MPVTESMLCRRASHPRRRSRAAARMNPDHRRLQEYVSSHQAHLLFGVINAHRYIVRNCRESQTEACAFSQLTLNFHCAAELGYDLLHDHKSKSSSMSSIFRRVKRIEDVTHHFRSHSRSGVRKIHEDALRFAGLAFNAGSNLNLSTIRHRIEAVVNQIQEQLLQTI